MVYFKHCCFLQVNSSPHEQTGRYFAGDIFKRIQMLEFRLKFHWSLVQLTNVGIHSGDGSATSHCLKLYRASSLSHICDTRGRWVLTTSADALWHVHHFVIMHMIRHVYQFSLLLLYQLIFLLRMLFQFILLNDELPLYVTNDNCYLYGNKFNLTRLDLRLGR